MKISTLLYTIKQGFANIFRNKWYSLASIATISACLFLFGLFYSIVANFQNILKTAEEGVSVTEPKIAIVGSFLRGIVAIVICAVILAKLFGLDGIWISLLAAETVTFLTILFLAYKDRRKRIE